MKEEKIKPATLPVCEDTLNAQLRLNRALREELKQKDKEVEYWKKAHRQEVLHHKETADRLVIDIINLKAKIEELNHEHLMERVELRNKINALHSEIRGLEERIETDKEYIHTQTIPCNKVRKAIDEVFDKVLDRGYRKVVTKPIVAGMRRDLKQKIFGLAE